MTPNFGEELFKRTIWDTARSGYGLDPEIWRLDATGRLIKFDEHGKNSRYGWEIHDIRPTLRTRPRAAIRRLLSKLPWRKQHA